MKLILPSRVLHTMVEGPSMMKLPWCRQELSQDRGVLECSNSTPHLSLFSASHSLTHSQMEGGGGRRLREGGGRRKKPPDAPPPLLLSRLKKQKEKWWCMVVAHSLFFNKLFAQKLHKTPPLPHKLRISQTTPKNTPDFLTPNLPVNSRKLGCYILTPLKEFLPRNHQCERPRVPT